SVKEDGPLFVPVPAPVADAIAGEGVAKVANARRASSHHHSAAGHFDLADDRLGQLRATSADQAVQAEDLPSVEAEADPARSRLRGEVSHLEDRLAVLGTAGQIPEPVRPANPVGYPLVLGPALD